MLKSLLPNLIITTAARSLLKSKIRLDIIEGSETNLERFDHMKRKRTNRGFTRLELLLSILGTALLLVTLRSPEMIKLLASILICWSLGHCIWLNYFRCTTDTEPYVYVQTYNDIYKFTDPVLQLAHSDPRAYQLVGHIIRASPYPLPWMLDDFGRVGYYEKNNMPDKVDGDFLLVQQDKITAVEAKLHDSYYTFPVTIRPYQDPSKAYFSARIFKSFFPGQWPDFTGAVPAPTPSPSPAK